MMHHQFTSGALRTLTKAAEWSSREDCVELEAPALLLGLLAETECRGALVLARHGIDAAAVRARWPKLTPCSDRTHGHQAPARSERLADDTTFKPKPFSAEVKLSIQAACERLSDYPQPLLLATEHLLLGLTAAEHEVSAWLRQQGLDADALQTEIHHWYGHRPGPLPLEPLELPDDALTQTPPGCAQPAGSPEMTPPSAPPAAPQPAPPIGPAPAPRDGISPSEEIQVLRVVDAAANRAQEGLRVVEDYVRFVLDDRHLTDHCKRLRHDLAAALGRISSDRRLAARETRADVGTQLTVPSERQRRDPVSVLAANFVRLQEALRSLEEFGKVLDSSLAADLEQLRYRTYTLQRAVQTTRRSLERLARARLYVLIDGRASAEQFEGLARSLVDCGVHLIQLRDKQLDDRTLLQRARLLACLTRQTETLFVINDRPDLAVLAGADGVHVGQEDLTVKDARTIVGPQRLVGVSTHGIEQARQAVLDGADYIGVGPTFPSGTKQFGEFPGVDLLRAVAAEIRLSAFAIGGITAENLPQVLATGIRRVAVSRAITSASDPAAAVKELLEMLNAE